MMKSFCLNAAMVFAICLTCLSVTEKAHSAVTAVAVPIQYCLQFYCSCSRAGCPNPGNCNYENCVCWCP